MSEVDIQGEVTEFAAEVALLRDRSRACVERFRAMEDEDVQYLFAERLGGLGSVIVPDLYALVLDDPAASASQRYLAAWVAVRLGDRGPAVEHLCREVTSDSPYALPAAHVLAQLGLPEGVEPITAAIRRVDAADTSSMIGWATALRDLGGTLPPEIRRAVAARTAPWAAATLLAEVPVPKEPDDLTT